MCRVGVASDRMVMRMGIIIKEQNDQRCVPFVFLIG